MRALNSIILYDFYFCGVAHICTMHNITKSRGARAHAP